MSKSYSYLLMLLCLLLPSITVAGPWSQKPGHFYIKASEGFFLANSFVDAQGKLRSDVSYFGATTSMYFEVGIWNGLQIQGLLPYTIAKNTYPDTTTYTQGSPADASIGLQWSIPRLSFPLAFKANLKLPLYDIARLEGEFGTESILFPAHGDGQLDLTLWLSAGYALRSLPLFFFSELGYRFRTELFPGTNTQQNFLDSAVLFAQAGYQIKRVLLSLQFQGILALSSDSVTKSFMTLGLGLYIPLVHGLGLEASVDPIIWSRNSSQGISFSIGLSLKK